MYDSSMKSETFPLAMPSDLLTEMRNTARDTGLSMADAMRQSMKLGLPKLREQLTCTRVTNVSPWPKELAKALYSQPDDDIDGIKLFMAAQSADIEE